MLDGLFDQDTALDIQEHFTDTGGASDHNFGLFVLIGERFAPRLRNLKDRKFHIGCLALGGTDRQNAEVAVLVG